MCLKDGFFADLQRCFTCMFSEYFPKIGSGAESEAVADLLHRPVGGGQQGYSLFAQDIQTQIVWRFANMLFEQCVQGRFAHIAVRGNLCIFGIRVVRDIRNRLFHGWIAARLA